MKITINNVPPEIEENWLIAVIALTLENKIKILGEEVTEKTNWTRISLKILTQTEALILEETVQVGETRFAIFVEGRKPLYFGCGKKGLVRTECNLPREEKKEQAA